MIKAVMFDMDGVIADTEPLHFLALKVLMNEFNIDLPESSSSDYIGLSEPAIWRFVTNKYKFGIDFVDFEKKRRQHLFNIINLNLKPANGLLQLLAELKKEGFKIALVTSSGREIVDWIIKKLDIEKYFQLIVSADDVREKKPSSEPYILALVRLKENPGSCVAIEDSSHGITSAKAAGIFCVGVKAYSSEKIVADADFIVQSLDKLNIIEIDKQLSPIKCTIKNENIAQEKRDIND